MTAHHLVIAPEDDLWAIQDQAYDLVYVDDGWRDMRHLDTGDLWTFLTHLDDVPTVSQVGLIFGPDLGYRQGRADSEAMERT